MTLSAAQLARLRGEAGKYDPMTGVQRGIVKPFEGARSSSMVSSLYAGSWMTAVQEDLTSNRRTDRDIDFDYNPFADPVIRARPELWKHMVGAPNKSYAYNLMHEYDVDRQLERKESSANPNMAHHLLFAALDPTVFLPIPMVRGMSLLRRAKVSGGAVAAQAGVVEGAAQVTDMTRQPEELIGAVAIGGILGGIVGAAAVGGRRSRMGRQKTDDRAYDDLAEEFDDTRANLNESSQGRYYDAAFRSAEHEEMQANPYGATATRITDLMRRIENGDESAVKELVEEIFPKEMNLDRKLENDTFEDAADLLLQTKLGLALQRAKQESIGVNFHIDENGKLVASIEEGASDALVKNIQEIMNYAGQAGGHQRGFTNELFGWLTPYDGNLKAPTLEQGDAIEAWTEALRNVVRRERGMDVMDIAPGLRQHIDELRGRRASPPKPDRHPLFDDSAEGKAKLQDDLDTMALERGKLPQRKGRQRKPWRWMADEGVDPDSVFVANDDMFEEPGLRLVNAKQADRLPDDVDEATYDTAKFAIEQEWRDLGKVRDDAEIRRGNAEAREKKLAARVAELEAKATLNSGEAAALSRFSRELPDVRSQMRALDDQLGEIDQRRDYLKDIFESDADNATMLGATRLEGSGADRIRWRQMAWYVLKNNTFNGELGERINRVADRLAMNPGLRMKGSGEGRGGGVSVEARKMQWYAREQEVEDAVWRLYHDYIGKPLPEEMRGALGASTKIFGRKAFHAARKGVNAVREGAQSVPVVRDHVNAPTNFANASGHLDPDTFFERVSVALWHGDQLPPGMATHGEAEAVRLAASKVRKFFDEAKADLRETKMLRSERRLMETIALREERHGALAEEMDIMRDTMKQWKVENHADLWVERDLLHEQMRRGMDDGMPEERMGQLNDDLVAIERELTRLGDTPMPDDLHFKDLYRRMTSTARKADEAQQLLDDAQSEMARFNEGGTKRAGLRAEDAETFNHTVYDRQAIAANRVVFRDILAQWFDEQPWHYDTRAQDWVKADSSLTARRERADRMIDRILGNDPLTDGDMAAQFLENVRADISELEAAITRSEVFDHGLQMKGQGPRVKRKKGNTKRYVKTPSGERYSPAFVKQNKDGSFTIHIDEDYIRAEFRKGTDGALDPQILKRWDNEEEVVRWFYAHEELHTRLRQRPHESAAEYEARINDEADNFMEEGLAEFEPGDPILSNPRLAQQRKRLRKLREREWEAINAGHMDFNPMAPNARLDIPRKRILQFVEKDQRFLMRHYTRQIHARVEIAREFGDSTLAREMREMEDEVMRLVDAEESTAGKRALAESWDKQKEAMRNLRDVVLGHYGMPDDPTAMAPRVVRMLQQHSHLALMGMATIAALGDTGKIIANYGFGPFFKNFGHLMRNQVAYRMSQGEVQRTGVATDVFMAGRVMQMADLGMDRLDGRYLDGSKFNKAEMLMSSATNKMWLLNGLALWTDSARRFAGVIGQDQMFRHVERMVNGTASKVDNERMARIGMTPELAQDIWQQFSRYGADIDDLRVANTNAWDNPETVKAFRALLAQDVSNAVVNPGAADKPLFMHKWMYKLIFQYMGFGMSMTQRAMMSFHGHRNDLNVYMGMASMIGLAGMIEDVRRPSYQRPSAMEWGFAALERSGVTGVLMDMNRRLEYATQGRFGLRPALGLPTKVWNPNISHTMSGVMGPAAGLWSALAWSQTSDDATAFDQARAIRYTMPLANLWIWNSWLRDMQRQLGYSIRRAERNQVFDDRDYNKKIGDLSSTEREQLILQVMQGMQAGQ